MALVAVMAAAVGVQGHVPSQATRHGVGVGVVVVVVAVVVVLSHLFLFIPICGISVGCQGRGEKVLLSAEKAVVAIITAVSCGLLGGWLGGWVGGCELLSALFIVHLFLLYLFCFFLPSFLTFSFAPFPFVLLSLVFAGGVVVSLIPPFFLCFEPVGGCRFPETHPAERF